MTTRTDPVTALRDPGLGNTSYVVGVGDGLAVAIDPPRDVDAHCDAARAAGSKIVASLETHLHADFVSGSRELADREGAETLASCGARMTFAHRCLNDGDRIPIGDVELVVMHTPGHTPEHVSYVLHRDGEPEAVFTGGSLIGGGAARTDLISPDRTVELARAQFASFRRLAELPDDVAVHPTHGAGSFCSAGSASESAGTIGDQRKNNPLFAIDDEERFVRELLSGYGSFPPYFLRLRDVNAHGPRLLRAVAGPLPLEPTAAHDLVGKGAWLIDARNINDWAAAHPAGAVSIQLRPAFASWLGWVVPFEESIVLLVEPHDLPEAVRQSHRIGYDRIVGWIDGGIDAWRAADLPTKTTDEVDPAEAARRAENGALLVDVRQRSEHAQWRVPGVHALEVGDIIAGRRPPSDDVITFCAHGERAATAASLLERSGRVANLIGGVEAWEEAGLPVERDHPA